MLKNSEKISQASDPEQIANLEKLTCNEGNAVTSADNIGLQPERDLTTIGFEVDQVLEAERQSSFEIGRLLSEAKTIVKTNNEAWLPWLEERDITERRAQQYMQLYRRFKENPKPVSDLGFSKAYCLMRLPTDEDMKMFLGRKHDVGGKQKLVSEMSKRELNEAIIRFLRLQKDETSEHQTQISNESETSSIDENEQNPVDESETSSIDENEQNTIDSLAASNIEANSVVEEQKASFNDFNTEIKQATDTVKKMMTYVTMTNDRKTCAEYTKSLQELSSKIAEVLTFLKQKTFEESAS